MERHELKVVDREQREKRKGSKHGWGGGRARRYYMGRGAHLINDVNRMADR